ncbi:MAG: DUF533 domain-containing protein [Pseudomonadales bacterium]
MRALKFDLNSGGTALDGTGRRAILRAMVSAVNADGHMDTTECQSLFAQADHLQLSIDDRLFMLDEIREPKSIEVLAAEVQDAALARRIYKSVLAVVDECRPESSRYLMRLAGLLNLAEAETSAIRELSDSSLFRAA